MSAPASPLETRYATDDGRQQLLICDCLEAFADLPDESVDIVVTSPPYNIGLDYHAYNDSRSPSDYHAWLARVYAEVRRTLKPQGSFFLNLGAQSKDAWLSIDAAQPAREFFELQNRIIWLKSVSVNGDSVGHFKPINSQRFLNNLYEEVFHFTKHGDVPLDRLAIGVPFKHKSNIARWGHAVDKRCRGNVWFIPYKTVQSKSERHDHPATFPVELVENCVRLQGFDSETLVLDPFVGTGTALLAAHRLGVRGLGFEIDEKYAASAWERLLAETKASAV